MGLEKPRKKADFYDTHFSHLDHSILTFADTG